MKKTQKYRWFIQSKKAQGMEIPLFGEKMLFFVIGAVIISLFAVGYIMSTSSYVYKTTIMPKNLQRDLYVTRFLSSPSCFAYQDTTTQRVYPSYVDSTKFNEEQLDACLQFPKDKNDLCYELRLTPIQKQEQIVGTEEEKPMILSSNNVKPACTDGAAVTVMKRPVIIVQHEQRIPGVLSISEFVKQAQT